MDNKTTKKERFHIECDDMNQINDLRAFYGVSRRVLTFEQWKQKHAGDGGSNKAWTGFGGAFGIDKTKNDENETEL